MRREPRKMPNTVSILSKSCQAPMGDSREQERRDNSQHQDNTNMPNFSQI